jgi:hypothetical protein
MTPNGDLVGLGLPRPGRPLTHWREVAPWVWQAVGGDERMGARLDARGQVSAIAFEPLAFAVPYTRAPWWRASSGLLPLLLIAIGALLLTTLSWPLRVLARIANRASFPYQGPRAHAHRAASLAALLGIFYVAAWAGFFGWIATSLATVSSAGPAGTFLGALYAAGVLIIMALVGAALANVLLWRAPSGWFARIWGAVLLISVSIVAWFAAVMNFFSFQFRY